MLNITSNKMPNKGAAGNAVGLWYSIVHRRLPELERSAKPPRPSYERRH